MVTDEDKVENLLKQVTTLADTLSFAFGTPSGIPDPTVILNPSPRLKGSGNNGIAGCGTLVLEWTRLTDITGNQTYTELTQKAEDHLLNPKGSPEAFPGLVGEGVSLETGEFLDSQGGWTAFTSTSSRCTCTTPRASTSTARGGCWPRTRPWSTSRRTPPPGTT